MRKEDRRSVKGCITLVEQVKANERILKVQMIFLLLLAIYQL